VSEYFRIKPMEWKTMHGSLSVADTPFGKYTVWPFMGEWAWQHATPGHVDTYQRCESLADGQAACEAHWSARIQQALVPVEATKTESAAARCRLCGDWIEGIFCGVGCENDGRPIAERPPGDTRMRIERETVIREVSEEEK